MATKFKFAASSTTVISLAASLANDANTYSGLSGCTMTALDNSTDLYPHVQLTINVPDTFAAAPTAGGWFDLWMVANDVDGTSDETPVPGATDIEYLAHYLGSLYVDNQDVAYRRSKRFLNVLAGVTNAHFFLRNKTGQAASYSSNPITVKATPFTFEDA